MNGLSLGIPGVGIVSPGTHFCALYSGPAERDRLLYPFLEEGLRHGDKCLCLIDDVEPALVRDRAVGQPGAKYAQRSDQLDVERASDAYLRSGEFSVEDMMSFLSERVDSATKGDFDLLRAAGEMSWVLPEPPGWEALFRWRAAPARARHRASSGPSAAARGRHRGHRASWGLREAGVAHQLSRDTGRRARGGS
ncbi:MAG TPA: MEDS domain-containing protein [Nocardioidaceae bacterium]|nr:MEDS domain-containing protein [Nocardioidaceae bacterium]